MATDEIKLWRANTLGYCNLYIGRKGGWKTQQAVIDAYEAHKSGKIVISNCWLDFEHIRFQKWKDLPPILKEISEYCNLEKMPIEAPLKLLKEYGLERKEGKVQEFFLLFDEIGNHLNTRNWSRNFKDDFLRDMLTEPRKYWLTIVWITQSWKRVDSEFREACEDWYLFSKLWRWIFERRRCTHLWVHNGEFDFDKPIILWTNEKWTYFDKILKQYQKMYYTGEISWDWAYSKVPHRFVSGSIFSPIETVPDTSSEAKPEGPEDNALVPVFVTTPIRKPRWRKPNSLTLMHDDKYSILPVPRKRPKKVAIQKVSVK